MRSSKSRSRSKGNRNRSMGNIVNRVFDSSGPEGKVRGTPQQIIDKYNQLARDAQLSNDRVAAENFQQHAEHYLRMLAEAQREMQERQQQAQQNQGNSPGSGDQPRGDSQSDTKAEDNRSESHQSAQEGSWSKRGRRKQQSNETAKDAENDAGDVIDVEAADSGGLVDTPEDKPKRTRRPRSKPAETDSDAEQADHGRQATPDAAE